MTEQRQLIEEALYNARSLPNVIASGEGNALCALVPLRDMQGAALVTKEEALKFTDLWVRAKRRRAQAA